MALGYYAELGSPGSCSHFKADRELVTIKANNLKAIAILRFTLLSTTLESGLFFGARLYVCVFERVPGTCFVSPNIVLTELAICT